jgi:hypothetical protein
MFSASQFARNTLSGYTYWLAALCMAATTAAPIQADEISDCADSIQLVNSRDKDFRCNHALNDQQSYCAADVLLALRGGCSRDLTVMATVECEGVIAMTDGEKLIARDAALVELGPGGSAGIGELDLLWPIDKLPGPDDRPKLLNTSCKIIDRNVYPY